MEGSLRNRRRPWSLQDIRVDGLQWIQEREDEKEMWCTHLPQKRSDDLTP